MLFDQRCVTTGINSFFAALAGSLPNTTFAQNNGVLALTRCASRTAGYSCGIWLFLFGVLAKVMLRSVAAGAFQACIVATPSHVRLCIQHGSVRLSTGDMHPPATRPQSPDASNTPENMPHTTS